MIDLHALLDELIEKAGAEAAEAVLREALADLAPQQLTPLDQHRPRGVLDPRSHPRRNQ